MIKAAIVLEGGSLRGLFTSGVLDVLVEEEMECSYVNGVSAGSMNGMNYISKQTGRTLKINTEYLHDKRYLSFENMVKNRQIFNFEFLFGELSTELIPFDFDAFYQSPQTFEVVATRCRTGAPEYFEKSTCSDMMAAVEASSSIPVMSKMMTIDGKKYLDGGVSLPIAYQRALDLGYDKIILILTRHNGFQKPPLSPIMRSAYARYFAPLPKLQQALHEVPGRYNRMQLEINQLEQEGRIFVIRPEFPVKVARLEKDIRKLTHLYHEGRRIARQQMPALQQYLEN
ncbi:MAG: patatin-like phospholipase family protein [Lachnospiraceae bacterium]